MSIRRPVVAGQFYPLSAQSLETEITKSFKHPLGPGTLPSKRTAKRIYGAIVPHAGYTFSGAGAAHVYKFIGETLFPDVYIILGVNHSGPTTCTSDEDWETPLGTVKCDTEFVKRLGENGIQTLNNAHHHEHSIELQLPFLQTVSKDNLTKLRIVPIMIADDKFDIWGQAIKKTIQDLKRRAVIICSSDFTHYGENYDYVPFKDNVKENMYKLDNTAINFITKPNPKSFLEYTKNTEATICGKYGIATLLWLIKYLSTEHKGTLLKYYTSGDILGDYSNAVGYAAIVF